MTHRSPPSPLAYAWLLALPIACGDPGEPATTDTAPTSTGASTTDAPGTTSTTGGPADPTTTTDLTSTDASAGETTGTGDPDPPATTSGGTTTGGLEELPPTDSADALELWLAAGSYKTWAAESKVHASTGPHGGNVRTYVNAPLVQSLSDVSPEHPQGAATVKELYSGGMDTIVGYAVMVKVAPVSGAAGEGWYWYERLDQNVYADGTGVGLCSDCHGAGVDNILTPFPLQ